MNVGSLFSGIGGFDYGLERAGMRVVWQCEADEFCRRALAERWPGVPCYPDVRELTGASVAPVDVLCGGFPCQDISLAGKGAGIDGARSGLWGEYARLVGELRPRYVIVENVAALLTRGLGRVLGDLAALGYDAEWDCLPASSFGAPHRRDRLWLIAYPHTDERRCQERSERDGNKAQPGLQASQWHDADGLRPNVADSEGRLEPSEQEGDHEGRSLVGPKSRTGRGVEHGGFAARGRVIGRDQVAGRAGTVADPDFERREGRRPHGQPEGPESPLEPARLGAIRRAGGAIQDTDECAVQPWRIGGRAAQAGGSQWWAVEPPVGRVAHGVPDRLAQLAALGNALVPQIAEWIGTQILDYERSV